MDNKKMIDNVVQRTLKGRLNRLGEAAKEEMLKTRRDIVAEWFVGTKGATSMTGATMARYSTPKVSGNKATMTISSFILLEDYEDKPNAERWRAKYGGQFTGKEYVLNLQLYQGIIGLPEKSWAYPEHAWVNSNFIQRQKLWYVLMTSKRWDICKENITKRAIQIFEGK